ncbi:hypothetical protein PoB_003030200 [Plakobranchus ocellatus]|uniref:Uncharacterized protein n=1 Tax=Plakobranchus ocellatus TaxID=259542 RepID=A0AAV4AA14_9GAST|nr:hypothetical protein PoB_003030200 [Plakobranchus ocellatus]
MSHGLVLESRFDDSSPIHEIRFHGNPKIKALHILHLFYTEHENKYRCVLASLSASYRKPAGKLEGFERRKDLMAMEGIGAQQFVPPRALPSEQQAFGLLAGEP